MDDKLNGVIIGVIIGALTLRWIYGLMVDGLWFMKVHFCQLGWDGIPTMGLE